MSQFLRHQLFVGTYLWAHAEAITTYALATAHEHQDFLLISAVTEKSPSPCLLPRRKITARHNSVSSTLVWPVCIVTQVLKRVVGTCLQKNLLKGLCTSFSSTLTLVSFVLLWTVKAGLNSVQVVPEGLFCLCFPSHFYVHIKQVWNVEAAESKQKILNWILCPVFNRNRKQSCAPHRK